MSTLALLLIGVSLAAVFFIRPRPAKPTGRPAGAWITARENAHQWTDTPKEQQP